ncbi:non-structural maintenance of chromosomes element 4 homolog A-like isoform X3 [Mangifera indica]|uniref:non-structural maintenance of chromosomes element 4 homolog A-like isoform X3 n=1 Tax=Mangifera indica TaxID=29780 RepID=UPI001CFB764C|nr:non-structural maintenance of chromosomes element 4 homolog A-like isoform X3 [Mangifera indica]XP_044509008.1 non-structural maintenance of chromosomes element 4 homolog A-like isoform X3 [Mangifera indica]XP_044509009.1 non-structural maintenance of chromosomes element 4 homolog A-like isoform X3 [Mangifera indica]
MKGSRYLMLIPISLTRLLINWIACISRKPREQVADAETLLDITSTVVHCVQAENNNGITISDFVSSIIRDFGEVSGPSTTGETGRASIAWADVGVAVASAFGNSCGCSTMVGPMNIEPRERKAAVRRKRVNLTENSQPEELGDAFTEEQVGTDNNMLTMFNILKKNRRVRLENLILNRSSFSQTVENLFALSFLVKDGRAEIKLDENNHHLVSPRNAPSANAVASSEVTYSHFIFRFDFKDWKLMTNSVGNGEELMPHRNEAHMSSSCQLEHANVECQETAQTVPIRKLSRNRGLVLHEQTVVEVLPENDPMEARRADIRKGKCKVV